MDSYRPCVFGLARGSFWYFLDLSDLFELESQFLELCYANCSSIGDKYPPFPGGDGESLDLDDSLAAAVGDM